MKRATNNATRFATTLSLALLLLGVSDAYGLSDRRQIIAFGTPGSGPMVRVEEWVSRAQCRLVDRDVDVRIVDILELQPLDGTDNISSELQQMIQLRGEDEPPFEIVLIGKDGGTKARSVEPEMLEAFLAQIDTMPMRRAELRRAGRADSNC